MDQYKSINVETGRHAMELAQQEWGNLSLNPAFGELVSEPDRTCTVAGEWYVVSIEHQQGQLAIAEIASRGMVAYLPMIPRSERHGRGGLRLVWRPLFGLYMFIRCVRSQWALATAARGVRRFLGRNGQPEPIDERHIEVIRLVEAEEGEQAKTMIAAEEAASRARSSGRSGIVWHFTQGDRVRIKKGPLSGFYADLTGRVDVHDRIRALVSLFGGKSVVELSAFEIEKAI